MGRAERAARGPACFGPAQARPGTKEQEAGPARPDSAGWAWAGSVACRAARGPACIRGRPVKARLTPPAPLNAVAMYNPTPPQLPDLTLIPPPPSAPAGRRRNLQSLDLEPPPSRWCRRLAVAGLELEYSTSPMTLNCGITLSTGTILVKVEHDARQFY
jgi:hypothetical protein